MAFVHYLAMTPTEYESMPHPEHPAWMACHFSENSTGITVLPKTIAVGTLLILNDRIPFVHEDPTQIIRQLLDAVEQFSCPGLLLDFQRPATDSVKALTEALAQALPCPVPAPPEYATREQPVFLPPVPPDIPLPDYIAPWKGRKIWLETALNGSRITLTADGSRRSDIFAGNQNADSFSDDQLHCHYKIAFDIDTPVFTLWRTQEDLCSLLKEAEMLDVSAGVGLYQELWAMENPRPSANE